MDRDEVTIPYSTLGNGEFCVMLLCHNMIIPDAEVVIFRIQQFACVGDIVVTRKRNNDITIEHYLNNDDMNDKQILGVVTHKIVKFLGGKGNGQN